MSLASLKELLGRRTPGPWRYETDGITDEEMPGGWIFPHGAYSSNPADNESMVILSNAADELVAVAQAAQDIQLIYADAPREAFNGSPNMWAHLDSALSALYAALEGEGERD